MNTTLANNRLNKLSLKKTRRKADDDIKLDTDLPCIVLDESIDQFTSRLSGCSKSLPKIYSPIVINDSCELSDDSRSGFDDKFCKKPQFNRPSRSASVLFNKSFSEDNRPSLAGSCSPGQQFTCIAQESNLTPSTPRNVSTEECSMKKIELSHKKILDELYGDVWKSLPNLFKSKKIDDYSAVTKRLNFDDDEDDISNKENIKGVLAENKKLYLTDSGAKHKVRIEDYDNVTGKAKKKLYSEKIPNTPEPKSLTKKRHTASTTKKPKSKTVTELVKNSHFLSENVHENIEKVTNIDDLRKVTKSKAVKENNATDSVERLSFMASLAANVPSWRCHVEAMPYKDDFKNKRELLAQRLYEEFNRRVFEDGLHKDMLLLWDTKLTTTAGITVNRLIKNSKGERFRKSVIKFSTKVVDSPMRLRDTLVHEMCHAATWLLDNDLKAGHGPLWKKWAIRAIRTIPELGEISRCHNMDIHFKYSYKCTQCGYGINRHSKSIDTTKQCCGYCRGTFQLILNKKTKDGHVVSTPAKKGQTSDFARYVKEMYGTVKVGKTHAETMKILGKQFTATKNKS